MRTFHVTLMRDPYEEKRVYWLAHAEEDERAHTYGRTISEAKLAAVEVISLWFDLDPEEFEVVWNVELPEAYQKELDDIRALRASLADIAEAINRRQRDLARRLTGDLGLTYRDAGELLGLSYQRIGQLVQAS